MHGLQIARTFARLLVDALFAHQCTSTALPVLTSDCLLALQLLCPESGQAAAAAAPTPEQLASAEMAVLQQADLVRQLKANGLGNSSPEVQQHVQVGSSCTAAHDWCLR
jgi:hypothetical protein